MDTKFLSYITLSQENFAHNIQTLRALGHKDMHIAFAVKGNAYGHGLTEMVKIADPLVEYFVITNIDDLRILRRESTKPTFVFGYIPPYLLDEAMNLGCILGVFSFEHMNEIDTHARALGKVQEVHIACDANLGREGFLETDMAQVFSRAKDCTGIQVTGMYAHFANIEDTNDFSHAQKQIDTYARMQAIARESGYEKITTHISATSGLLTYEKDTGIHPIVRIGIGGYGLWPRETLERQYKKRGIELKPVLSWKTHVAQVKIVPIGVTVGYGLTYKTQRETKMVLVPQGYADGFPRALSNTGMVLIGGRRCPVIGRVSMNMFVVDATNVDEVHEGDEVVLIGEQGDKSISANEVAERSGTISYEAVTRISPLLPRVIC
ncbi:MAG: alanine racemase [bacterium]